MSSRPKAVTLTRRTNRAAKLGQSVNVKSGRMTK